MSAPSCRPRFVNAISSACAAATASSKNSSKKSPIRKNSRQPGFASLISRYWAITGVVLVSGGPIAAVVAALVGAGRGGAALKELFDDYTAPRHAEDFEAALHAGAALLWVRCEDSERELRATRVLEEAGGRHVHVHGRPPRSPERGG